MASTLCETRTRKQRHKVFDLHCDTPHNIKKNEFNHIVPDKLHKHNYYGVVFAHFIKPESQHPFVDAVRLLFSTIAYMTKNETMHTVLSDKDLDENKVNVILGVEGGHIFDASFKQFETLYNLGVRVFTLTWNNSNKLAHSALDADKKGITNKGRAFLKECANYDIILDLSHASTKTVIDVCSICKNQIIASHSCVRSLKTSFLRNIDDRAIKAIADRNGVVGINFSKYHLGKHGVVDHIDYLKDNFGIDTLAIGSDFDGINDSVYSGPKDVKKLRTALRYKGYKKKDIDKIFSENFLKVFQKASQ